MVGGAFNQKFSSIVTSQPGVQKLEEQEGNRILEDEFVNIRQQFDAARERFLRIPDALKEMPKVDPKGYEDYSAQVLKNTADWIVYSL